MSGSALLPTPQWLGASKAIVKMMIYHILADTRFMEMICGLGRRKANLMTSILETVHDNPGRATMQHISDSAKLFI